MDFGWTDDGALIIDRQGPNQYNRDIIADFRQLVRIEYGWTLAAIRFVWEYRSLGSANWFPGSDNFGIEFALDPRKWRFGADHFWYDCPNCVWNFGPVTAYRSGYPCRKCEP